MSNSIRMTARIVGDVPGPTVKHYRGLPPELTGGDDLRQQMEAPVLLEIEETKEGILLNRYTTNGQVVGDTWHMTIEDAKQQANFEFPASLSDWKHIPPEIEDVVGFGLNEE